MNNRELDAWLAEHLFGWRTQDNGRLSRILDGGREAEGIHYTQIPAYSSTGDGMLLVLEAMGGRGWLFAIDQEPAPPKWAVSAYEPNIGGKSSTAICSDSLPLAVALVAKAALSA